ncbi:aminoglycoside phosphotransferase family protein [Priestia flexa]|uniref:Aminoglycoside phosphotransferase family protein n=1 Tax=Priestia flexa TaxID=86664 RepID=A0ABU4J9C2_9BACI|nr:aminoglycoside phosphotransferase family protein [Priestia flexa]MDW8517588.1 aminoglycoside phosphotransferase family protein [Priestia flexa]SIR27986.1 Ser/Thr protein kinase RdoA involved in Cpx stress response, MazF antagonist [Priestia flexa]
MNQVKSILKDFYDIDISGVLPQQGGWASLAYKVLNKNQSYFLKVYEKSRASTPKLTALIDQYVPILVWLINNSSLNGKITVPLITNSGEYKCEDENAIYLLYDYIEGETIGDRDLTDDQVHQFSKIITELHSYEDIPIGTDAIKEDFDVPFIQSLRQKLKNGREDLQDDVWTIINSCISPLNNLIQTVEVLSQNLKNCDLRMALCHTDLHYWNLMQSGQGLILIDWEGLKLAPVEADLMFLVDKPYFAEFLSVYQNTTHRNFEINPHVLKFYQGRRRLEDIWEFIEQLLYDEQDEQERYLTKNYLRKELNSIGGNFKF